MSPKLRQKYPNLPKYVTESNGRIVYRPRIAPQDQTIIPTDKHGYLKPPIRLGPSDAPEAEILAAYLRASTSLDNQRGAKRRDLRWIIDQYKQSRAFRDLAPGTQKRTTALEKILDHPLMIDGHQQTLGDLQPGLITKPIARRIAEKRLNNYQAAGKKGNVMVNREITFLSTAINWATQHLDGMPTDNPFRISKFAETSATRYVTDEEYALQTKLAAEIADYLPVVFELTYLLASRGVETLDIKLSDINPDRTTGGILVRRRKGSKDNIIEWSDRLHAAYQAAKNLHAKFTVANIEAPLIIGSHGHKLSQSGIGSAMQRLKKKMDKQHGPGKYWNLHALKHKGITDAKDKHISGHKSESMRQRYDHEIPHHKPAR